MLTVLSNFDGNNMLFDEKLVEIGKKLSPEFDRLFSKIIENQKHTGDLLLIQENGFYNPDVLSWNGLDEKMSPYMIGPGHDGHSYHTHYEFIHDYRSKAITDIKISEYLEELKYSPERINEIDRLKSYESQTIQLEMLIFLKIWEADYFIKMFYQFARLLHSKSYDWHFKIAESNRDAMATGNRQMIIRELVCDKLKDEFPIIFQAFKIAYNSQIRNSIAHSKYSIISRAIRLNNYIEKDLASQLQSISFDDWIEMFHTTLMIYNEQIGLINKSKKYYSDLAENNDNIVQVQINRKYPEETEEIQYLEYRKFDDDSGRWTWFKQNRSK